MISTIIVLFGFSLGILTIVLGIMTSYRTGAANRLCPPNTDKICVGTEEADGMVRTSGVNIVSISNVYSIDGGAGADSLSGGQDENRIRGGEGSDHMLGGFNSDSISGENGEDYIDGGSGNDRIVGGAHDDILIGFEGNDLISSNAENHTKADGYRDSIDCGPGEDEAWINVSNDGDVATNCESLHAR